MLKASIQFWIKPQPMSTKFCTNNSVDQIQERAPEMSSIGRPVVSSIAGGIESPLAIFVLIFTFFCSLRHMPRSNGTAQKTFLIAQATGCHSQTGLLGSQTDRQFHWGLISPVTNGADLKDIYAYSIVNCLEPRVVGHAQPTMGDGSFQVSTCDRGFSRSQPAGNQQTNRNQI
jgi:hypothetical protein